MLLRDPLKTFDWLSTEFIIAKPNAYELSSSALKLMSNNLTKRKQ